MVIDTGEWLPGRKVLVPIELLEKPNSENRRFPVKLTVKQIEESPLLSEDAPVSYDYEKKLHNYLKDIIARLKKPSFSVSLMEPEGGRKSIRENHLRSSNEIIGYHVQATDGKIGYVEDFIFDDDTWIMRYIIVNTRSWLPGRKVLVSPFWTKNIDWVEKKIFFDLTSATIKNSPTYDPLIPVNRKYELMLYDYYGRPKYWE